MLNFFALTFALFIFLTPTSNACHYHGHFTIKNKTPHPLILSPLHVNLAPSQTTNICWEYSKEGGKYYVTNEIKIEDTVTNKVAGIKVEVHDDIFNENGGIIALPENDQSGLASIKLHGCSDNWTQETCTVNIDKIG